MKCFDLNQIIRMKEFTVISLRNINVIFLNIIISCGINDWSFKFIEKINTISFFGDFTLNKSVRGIYGITYLSNIRTHHEIFSSAITLARALNNALDTTEFNGSSLNFSYKTRSDTWDSLLGINYCSFYRLSQPILKK